MFLFLFFRSVLITLITVIVDDEKACSFAIAEMRQYPELFEQIVSQHDKALEWIANNELVYEAREIIFKHRVGQTTSPNPNPNDPSGNPN